MHTPLGFPTPVMGLPINESDDTVGAQRSDVNQAEKPSVESCHLQAWLTARAIAVMSDILRPDQFISKALRKSKQTACERLVRMTRAPWLDCGENAIGRIVPE
jgi:hypothetical protein